MKLAIINNTPKGTSGGHIRLLEGLIQNLSKDNNIQSTLILSPPFYKYKKTNNKKFIFNHFKAISPLVHKPSLELKKLIKAYQPDLIYIPNERFLYFKGIKTVIMVRNMEPFVRIKNNPLREKFINYLKRLMTIKSCKKASHIIAVSDYVKDTLMTECNISKDKITRVYHGGIKIIENDKLQPINHEKFIFTAGSIRPARGLEDIIYAYGILKRKKIDVPVLVIAGDCINMDSYKNNLIKLAIKVKVNEDIIWLGKVNQETMGWCFKNSIASVISSRVESFCFIALEAMSYGSKIISSDNKCLPEILGDSALFYKDSNSKNLANCIKSILLDRNNEKNRQNALNRALQFSSAKNYENTYQVFKNVLSAKNNLVV